jgi:hypothetical protein
MREKERAPRSGDHLGSNMTELPRSRRTTSSWTGFIGAVLLSAFGCSHSNSAASPGMDASRGPGGEAGGGSPGEPDASNGTGGSGGAVVDSGASPDVGPVTPITKTPAMPVISENVPAFASSSSFNDPKVPGKANDLDTGTTWVSNAVPAWLAYDLSGVPADKRKNVLVAWYGPRTQDHLNEPTPASFTQLPIDYTIEINTGAGGGMPPTAGWTTVATVTNNIKNSLEHLVALNGANWVRMNISKGPPNAQVSIDMDVHSAPDGATDAWLFMGDSITAISLSRAFSNLQRLVHDLKPSNYPAVIGAGVGGTSTGTAVGVIDKYLKDYPGRFVVLGYGTNDHPKEFQMEALVQKVLAAGKIPVIPHMPWSDARLEEGPMINAMIDALYAKYPQVVRGPDLWAGFTNRGDLIASGDVHPNQTGQLEWRKMWAAMMVGIYQ